ncbi:hypothetical protein GCM10023178_73920 [Actinomadura luteofluorescens]
MSISDRIVRARLMTWPPSGVGSSPDRLRVNSTPPTISSTRRSWFDIAGWDIPIRAAARVTLPVSAIAHTIRR